MAQCHDSVRDLLGMSEEQLKALIAKVQTDKSLQKTQACRECRCRYSH